jgi:hypothetical protein
MRQRIYVADAAVRHRKVGVGSDRPLERGDRLRGLQLPCLVGAPHVPSIRVEVVGHHLDEILPRPRPRREPDPSPDANGQNVGLRQNAGAIGRHDGLRAEQTAGFDVVNARVDAHERARRHERARHEQLRVAALGDGERAVERQRLARKGPPAAGERFNLFASEDGHAVELDEAARQHVRQTALEPLEVRIARPIFKGRDRYSFHAGRRGECRRRHPGDWQTGLEVPRNAGEHENPGHSCREHTAAVEAHGVWRRRRQRWGRRTGLTRRCRGRIHAGVKKHRRRRQARPRDLFQLRHDLIPDSGDRPNEARRARIISNRLPDLNDALHHGIVGDRCVPPDRLEQFLLGNQPIAVTHEVLQDLQRLLAQVNPGVSADDAASSRVDLDIVETVNEAPIRVHFAIS